MLTLLAAFVAALVLGTFVEYWGHRLMHEGWFLRRHHAKHHAQRYGQGVLGEFRDYFLPTLTILWVGFLVSPEAGVGFAAGDVAYAFLAAWSHQIQHERPELCFWMARPTHRVHHDQQMWRHNFGITVDVWDRVFGTYEPIGEPTPSPWRHAPAEWLRIHWTSPSPAMPPVRREPARSWPTRDS
jgi:sterol desaturase/sphingolipid hydroxylase (fatty acid hydroxylase superfamily)